MYKTNQTSQTSQTTKDLINLIIGFLSIGTVIFLAVMMG